MMPLIDRLVAAQKASDAADRNGLRREALEALDSRTSESKTSDAAAWLKFAALLSKHKLYREASLLLIRSVRLQPMQPMLLQALSSSLVLTDQFEAAEKTLSLAVRLRPELDSAWSSRGHALMRLLRFDEAIGSFERCQELRPLVASELNRLAICLQKEGRLEEALARFDQALLQKPEDPELKKNRAFAMLTRELTAEAWLGYEARFDAWECQGRFRLLARPLGERWSGAGPWPQQLLVVAEQGLGDVLQFVRFVPLLLERVSQLQLCVPEKLMGLLRSSLPESVEVIAPELLVSQPAVPWLALLSLPCLLEINEASCLSQHPYLHVGAERIAAWRARLCRDGELLIGLHWQGNPLTEKSYLRGRSLPLEQLAPLASIPGVSFLSLQRGAGAEQLDGCSFRSAFVDDQDEISTVLDFEDTAAMVACCDVVVSSDSALAHLAGGLGVPTHLLLHPFSDWRWGLEGEHCRWYSSLRLHRQARGESWRAVVLRLAKDLALQHSVAGLGARLAQQLLGESGSDHLELILAAWPNADQGPQSSPLMPPCVSGYVINLDSASDRWLLMQSQIARLGWGSTHRRFAAQGASAAEAQGLGLRSAGELGLWRTTKTLLLTWLSQDPGSDALLHVLEDDAVLQPAFPKLIQPFQTCERRLDLLFTEAFITPALFERFQHLDQRRRQHDLSLLLIDGREYLACASSYLLSPSGARFILMRMEEIESRGTLLPLDLAYRKWIRSGDLTAAITLPFFSTIQPSDDSAIQADLDASIGLARLADLALRRLLYWQSWDRSSVRSVLAELTNLLENELSPEQQSECIVGILTHGRSCGWLGKY